MMHSIGSSPTNFSYRILYRLNIQRLEWLRECFHSPTSVNNMNFAFGPSSTRDSKEWTLESYIVDNENSKYIDIQVLKEIMQKVGSSKNYKKNGIPNFYKTNNPKEACFFERIYIRRKRKEIVLLTKENPYKQGTGEYKVWHIFYRCGKSPPLGDEFRLESDRVYLAARNNTWDYLQKALEKDEAARNLDPNAPLKHFTYLEGREFTLKKRFWETLIGASIAVAITILIGQQCYKRWHKTPPPRQKIQ